MHLNRARVTGRTACRVVALSLLVIHASLALSPPQAVAGDRKRNLLIGAAAPGLPNDLSGIEAFEDAAGTRPTLVSFYVDFGTSLDPAWLDTVADYGALPMITWEPWNASLDAIVAGDHDDHIRRWAGGARSWGKPILLRFAHEMNGDWYPWSASKSSVTTYVAAWRHVHEIFDSEGAENVLWIWSPNVVYEGSSRLTKLYPGDGYVDWVGIDGYNWGTTQEWSTWQSFGQVFGPTLKAVRRLSNKPIMLSEVGTSERGGDKGAWIKALFRALDRNRDIKALVWFNFDKETDWRIQSSKAARSAFRHGASRTRQPVARIVGR